MIRVFEVPIPGYEQPFKIASLTAAEADKYVSEAKEMMERNKEGRVAPEEWIARQRQVVCDALNKAVPNGGETWTPARLAAELDNPAINELNEKIMERSGLRVGEVPAAASPSPKSAAA